MNCPRCGEVLSEDHSLCAFCKLPRSRMGREEESTPSSNQALTVCPDCGHPVSRRATACPQCGAPIAFTPIEPPSVLVPAAAVPRPPLFSPFTRLTVKGFLFLAVGVVLYGWFIEGPRQDRAARKERDQKRAEAAAIEAAKPTPTQYSPENDSFVDPGETAVLGNKDGHGMVYLGRTREDWKAFKKALGTNDGYGWQALYMAGRAWGVKAGTVRVRLLQTPGWGMDCEVRVLSGEHTGESWWTDFSELKH